MKQTFFFIDRLFFVRLGSTSTSNFPQNNPNRHYLSCSFFVSPYQTVRSLADELAAKFNKNLEEIRLWNKFNEVKNHVDR